MQLVTLLSTLAMASSANAYALSAYPKLQAIYNKYNKPGIKCNTLLKDGFWDVGKKNMYDYCGDLGTGFIFLHRNGGYLNNMDVDCDGFNPKGGDCYNDPSPWNETAFDWKVEELSGGKVLQLDAKIHPYVVFGNEGSSPTFDPQQFGMPPLGVMAVVCNGQVHYGVWGDTNGGTSTGEASLAMAKMCFPNEGLNGNKGHDTNDVLYIGFRKQSSQPKNANWAAKDAATFETSIKTLGDSLVNGLPTV